MQGKCILLDVKSAVNLRKPKASYASFRVGVTLSVLIISKGTLFVMYYSLSLKRLEFLALLKTGKFQMALPIISQDS